MQLYRLSTINTFIWRKRKTLGLTVRQNKYLKNIIETAWIAIRKAPALTMSYLELIKRMDSQKGNNKNRIQLYLTVLKPCKYLLHFRDCDNTKKII